MEVLNDIFLENDDFYVSFGFRQKKISLHFKL